MRRKYINANNIWPGFVDAISSLLLVLIFILAIFIISESFLRQAISGKDYALESFRRQILDLNKSLTKKEDKNIRLSKMINTLNIKIDELINLNSLANQELKFKNKKIEEDTLQLVNLEEKVKSLFSKYRLEKSNLEQEKLEKESLREIIEKLNLNINEMKMKMSEIKNSLLITQENVSEKEVEIISLNEQLDIALKNKIGELTQYRSEFFGKLKNILGEETEFNVVGDRFVLQSEILFKSGSAKIENRGVKRINEISNLLKSITKKIPENIDWIIQVEGHSDNIPISNKDYPSNWELSTARAISVAKIMMKNGIEAKRINVAGYGEFRPLVENNSKENREKNRRIELRLTQP